MTALANGFEQALGWTGFRRLTPAEASSGPFARDASESRSVRLDAAAYNIGVVSRIESPADVVRFLEHQELNAWGYDLNLEKRADEIATVNELRFAVLHEQKAVAAELRWFGYQQQGESWIRSDSDCLVPSLGPDFGGEIFPCLGWVLMPGATSEFGPAEQRFGFCTTDIPDGALSTRDSRAYHFVYDGYPQRTITRRRIITLVDPLKPPSDVAGIVERALALTYCDA
jgi:hypothetical protein